MRVLLLNHNLRERGTWFRAWQIARELVRRGHEATLWTAAPHHYYRAAKETREGVRIVETPSWGPWVGRDDGWGPLDVVWRAFGVLREPFDLCYAFAHPPNVAVPAWLARRVRRRRLIYDWCDLYAGGILDRRAEMRRRGLLERPEPPLQRLAERLERPMERAMPRLAGGRVTVISRLLRDEAVGLGCPSDGVLLLPNGADLDIISPRDAGACRRELGLPVDGVWLAYVANYHPDQTLLLEAVARAAEHTPDLRLLTAGPPFHSGTVERLGLRGRLVELGRVPVERIEAVLGAADVLALPLADHHFNRSRMPYKFTQYLAAGRPVAACRVGDLADWFDAPDVLDTPDTIGIASAPDAVSFGDALARLLHPDTDRAAMGRAARRLAEGPLSWPVQVDRLLTWLGDEGATP